jgi:hypothetical protein
MNIEEYAAQFPIIKRENIKEGQTILTQMGGVFFQQVVLRGMSFSGSSVVRLVKDVVPQIEIEDGKI